MDKPAQGKSLSRSAMIGYGATIFSRLMRSLVGIVTISVLSRYISPAEFGLFSLIFFVMVFSQVFADFGLRVSLVQRKNVTDLEMNSVFWASFSLGVVMMLVVLLGADIIAGLFKEPGLAIYLRMISPLFLLISAQGVSMSILERGFKFPQMASCELTASILGALTAVGLALAGHSVLALVMQQIVITTVVAAMTFFYARWIPRFTFSMEALKPLISYGVYVTAAGAVQTIGSSADRPIVGTRISPTDLGFLTISQQIVMAPIRTIAANIRRVSFPIMSTIQDDKERLWRAYLTTVRGLVLVMAPICLGIWALALPITELLLGKAWLPVSELLGYLTIAALLTTVAEVNSAIFASKGRARFLFRWNILSAVMNIAVLLLAVPFGVVAVVIGKMAVNFVLVPLHTYFLVRLLEQKPWPVLGAVWKQSLAAAIMALLVYLLDGRLATEGLPPIPRLAIGAATGVFLYVGLMFAIDRKRSLEMVGKLRRR
ncbi:lipopolysaccharide biosynthesis protein [Sandaracinobacteroides hominis]|uniref:lipopolysaccharide biosynthesis protein n=1 Tax=Sandaracinobacteroides hominis TaxID=2780086 RepID=UPI0018F312FB|nr:lipopolysaccharide biosynthesis protein [Sandaracinobacteroides hominis]